MRSSGPVAEEVPPASQPFLGALQVESGSGFRVSSEVDWIDDFVDRISQLSPRSPALTTRVAQETVLPAAPVCREPDLEAVLI